AILDLPNPMHPPEGPVMTLGRSEESRMIPLLLLDQSPRYYEITLQVGNEKMVIEPGDEEAHIARVFGEITKGDPKPMDFYEQLTVNIPEELLRRYGLMLSLTFLDWKIVEVE